MHLVNEPHFPPHANTCFINRLKASSAHVTPVFRSIDFEACQIPSHLPQNETSDDGQSKRFGRYHELVFINPRSTRAPRAL